MGIGLGCRIVAVHLHSPVVRCLYRLADDGPCTLSQSGASEEGAISKAKRMMSEAATAQACVFLRGEGTDQR